MPYKSRAQQKYFHYLESKGKMPKKVVDEFDDTTAYDHLPEYAAAHGGMVPHMEHGEEAAPHVKQGMPKYGSGPSAKMQHGDEQEHMMKERLPHFADGGMVGMNYDYDMGHATEYDSSGEPHTEFETEDEHPMEYMSQGGRAKKMAKGGMVARSKFVKALVRGK